eukprot:2076825-Prorocentrum_lima.AAC.1
MTSSLVGSEMCIRDRCKLVSAAEVADKAAQVWNKVNDSQSWTNWDSQSPVSYTHLTLPTICSV